MFLPIKEWTSLTQWLEQLSPIVHLIYMFLSPYYVHQIKLNFRPYVGEILSSKWIVMVTMAPLRHIKLLLTVQLVGIYHFKAALRIYLIGLSFASWVNNPQTHKANQSINHNSLGPDYYLLL